MLYGRRPQADNPGTGGANLRTSTHSLRLPVCGRRFTVNGAQLWSANCKALTAWRLINAFSDCAFHLVAGGAANLAVQFGLGLLPQRRFGLGAAGGLDPVSVRTRVGSQAARPWREQNRQNRGLHKTPLFRSLVFRFRAGSRHREFFFRLLTLVFGRVVGVIVSVLAVEFSAAGAIRHDSQHIVVA